MDSIKLMEDLSNAFGVSGFETEISNVLKEKIEPFVDEMRTDVLGNLIATTGDGDLTLMLDAHMDEIGFMINHVEKEGFLRFVPIGGWDARILLTHAVTIMTRDGKKVRGVIGALPPHLLKEEGKKKPNPAGNNVFRYRCIIFDGSGKFRRSNWRSRYDSLSL